MRLCVQQVTRFFCYPLQKYSLDDVRGNERKKKKNFAVALIAILKWTVTLMRKIAMSCEGCLLQSEKVYSLSVCE